MDFVLLYFVIASFLIVIVPGPTVSLIIANSLKSGVKAGLLNVFGTQVGVLILFNNLLQSLFKSQILTLGIVILGIFLMFFILFRNIILSFIGVIPNFIAAFLLNEED